MAKNNIQNKLFRFIFKVLLGTLLAINVIGGIAGYTIQRDHTRSIETSIRNTLLSKGRTLVVNNSRALRTLAEDNAFLAIRELVSTTVADDKDVVRGMYMDADYRPWVRAGPDNPDGVVNSPSPLDDSTSIWAGCLAEPGFKELPGQGAQILEFAAPVTNEDGRLGTIRYGMSTAAMHTAVEKARGQLNRNALIIVGSFVLLSLIAVVVSLHSSRRQAATITSPLQTLTQAANTIAGGNYRRKITMDTDDEVGDLAHSFEIMRETVREYTEELEEKVTERTRRLREAMAELERSNRELEQFAYVASHDLREPLRMVSSYTQLLARRYQDKLDNDANDFINYAVDGAARMQRLIDDLLKYSRVGTRAREFAATDTKTVLDIVLKNLEVAVEERKAVVTRGDSFPILMADEGQLVQLFQNLVSNGLKFCKDRTPEINIQARQEDNGWRFEVRDNGIGIAPQHRERIFQIFQRLHTRDEYQGTGIGLAVCKKIVERHGGRIWVESEPGVGTTFLLTLPEQQQSGEPAESESPVAKNID